MLCLVRWSRCFQSRAQQLFHKGISRGWLLRSRGQSYPNQNRDHHLGHQDPAGFGREGTSHQRIDFRCSETFQLRWWHRWSKPDLFLKFLCPVFCCWKVELNIFFFCYWILVVCREGSNQRFVRRCSGRVLEIQTVGRFGCPQSLLLSSSLHHGVGSQGCWDHHLR